jgi:hypothetical protein
MSYSSRDQKAHADDMLSLSRQSQNCGGESLYSFVPQPEKEKIKPAMYRSKYDPRADPGGTKFAAKKGSGTFGKPLGASKNDPNQFLKTKSSNNRKTGKEGLGAGYRETRRSKRQPAVPKRSEKPVMGLQSTKNYITSNAVEAILAAPGNKARITTQQPVYLNKVDYGRKPAYLDDVKAEIQREEEMIKQYMSMNDQHNMGDDPEDDSEELSLEELDNLIDALKTKWDKTNANYQRMCHMTHLDTIGKVNRKESMEKELTQLEKDIEMLESKKRHGH